MKMDKPIPAKKGRFYKLSTAVCEKLDAASKESGMRKEAIVELALKRYFKNKR